MNNTRFATAIHIMTLLAKSPEDWLTSDWIAGSLNVNPVVVRKELSHLKKFGLAESRQGKEGGTRIAKDVREIKIGDIYQVVKNTEVLGKMNQNPNPKCAVGKDINKNLDVLFTQTDQLVIDFLSQQTLSNFVKQFN